MKNKVLITVVGILGLFSIFLTYDHYHFSSLPALAMETLPFVEANKDLRLSAKPYNPEESKLFLKRDLLSRGYQPVQITIENNSPSAYQLSLDEMKQKQVSPRELAMKVLQGSIPRAIGLKIASLIFWPFAIPSTIDSLRSIHTYNDLKKDYTAKQLKDETIAAYSTQHRILFLNKHDLKDPLTLILKDNEDGSTSTFLLRITS
jgi:hypothetical protein